MGPAFEIEQQAAPMMILQTKGLTKRYGELTIVDRVDLNVTAGTRHAIIGANGAGKSSLFHLITGRLNPTSGNVLFNGEDITGRSAHKVVKCGLSRSFQITNIFVELTARENLRLAFQAAYAYTSIWSGLKIMRASAEKAQALIESLRLHSVADQIAGTLSYGDQRRLEIGLALAAEPKLLLLDEPMAGMSQSAANEMLALLRAIPRSITLLLIEHDLDMVLKLSDHITVLHRGQVLAEGGPAEIQNDSRVQEAYLGKPIAPENLSALHA
jgi:branched-chain amino acid transport system ATP-binding protein